MARTSRFLIFVEDPGAVNCLAPLAEAMAEGGSRFALLSSGLATQLLHGRGLNPQHTASAAQALAALARAHPDWLLVGTSENPESHAFSLIAAARAAGVRSAAVIDSAANAAHRFRGRTSDALAHAPDYVLVPDEWTGEEFRALGLSAERVVVIGHAHDDHLRDVAARLRSIGADAIRARLLPAHARQRTVLVFASEISDGLDPSQYRRSDEYTLHGRGDADGRTEIVVEELLDAVSALESDGIARPYMVLRQHPKETRQHLAAYHSSFDFVSAGGDVFELLFGADLVIGMSSMLLAEAHALGTPVISLLPRVAERSWLPIVRDGAVPCATERRVFRQILRGVLNACASGAGRSPELSSRTSAPRSVARILAFLGSDARAGRPVHTGAG